MGGTKIMVLQMKEIIKTALFAVAGIGLLLLLVYFFIPKSDGLESSSTSYEPGTYAVTLKLSNGDVGIEVAVSEHEITSIGFSNLPAEQQVFYPLLEPTMEMLKTSIIDSQSLDVPVPADSFVTGSVLISAIDEALELARME
jgi:uncharacterized protein with FMN-binding domain